jgi:hypothetical protein
MRLPHPSQDCDRVPRRHASDRTTAQLEQASNRGQGSAREPNALVVAAEESDCHQAVQHRRLKRLRRGHVTKSPSTNSRSQQPENPRSIADGTPGDPFSVPGESCLPPACPRFSRLSRRRSPVRRGGQDNPVDRGRRWLRSAPGTTITGRSLPGATHRSAAVRTVGGYAGYRYSVVVWCKDQSAWREQTTWRVGGADHGAG